MRYQERINQYYSALTSVSGTIRDMPSLISFIVLYHLGFNYITESSKTSHYMLLLKPSLISGIGLC